MAIIYNTSRSQTLTPPQMMCQMQRLYDRYDLLCDACHNIRFAAEALKQCRDLQHSANLAALEEIGDELLREKDATHVKLEQLEAIEQDALSREARE